MTADQVQTNRLAFRISELARSLGTSRWTISRLIDRGEISATRIGSIRVVSADEVRRFLAQHEENEA